ncbi:transposase family protein [Amycolatopsis sp. CA-128772]|uniref:transposase family protein n=1 Tax=Amycolatopsis sp. CA-128772 TaxID=2073159 RepID=UPI00351A2EAF
MQVRPCLAAKSSQLGKRRLKSYRYSTNVQVAIDVETRLVIATGDPRPGNRNDCTVYRDSGIAGQLAGRPVMADGGYEGNPEVVMPYRNPVTAASCQTGRKTSTRPTARSGLASSTCCPG